MMFVAEQLFAAEDYTAALEGDGSNAGFLDVVSQYGATRPGRLAAHYAGVCYMKLGDFDAAMEYLNKYKKVKGAPGVIINALDSRATSVSNAAITPRPRCCMLRLRMLPTMCSPLLIISANLPSYMPNSAGWRRL